MVLIAPRPCWILNCEQLGLARETAFKVAAGFGNGMRMGGVCGVVTAAFMIIGLKHGNADATDKESKKKTHSFIKDFTKRFESQNGSVICKDLDKSLCTKRVQDTSKILEEIAVEYPPLTHRMPVIRLPLQR